MADSGVTQRVAAILAADAVGYTRLMADDEPEDARAFLDELGDPFKRIGADPDGRAGIQLGVYGVPQTFFVGPEGAIRYRHVGPIAPAQMDKIIRPLVKNMRQ